MIILIIAFAAIIPLLRHMFVKIDQFEKLAKNIDSN